MVKEYQVNNISGVLESLVKEVYDAEGRMIWYKIITGGRNRPGLEGRTANVSGPLCGGCFNLVKPCSEQGAPLVSTSHSAVRVKQESSNGVPPEAVKAKQKVKEADPEKISKKAKSAVRLKADGGASTQLATPPSSVFAKDKKGGITQTVLKFLGEFEDANIRSNRMREKNVLGFYYDVVKLCLISQGFLLAVFMFLAIVFVNVVALLFMLVLFATR